MSSDTPLSIERKRWWSAASVVRPRRLAPYLVSLAVIIAGALAWLWLWHYGASIAEQTLAGWLEREGAAGRAYSCATRHIGGFPMRIELRCADAVAEFTRNKPPLSLAAKGVTIAAQVYNPTLLTGDIVGPVTLAEGDHAPRLVADWARAKVSLRGLPAEPDSISFILDRARLDHPGDPTAEGGRGETVVEAEHADLQIRLIQGAALDHPIIEAVLRFRAAAAPTLYPGFADPIDGEIDAVLRGLKDLSPKPWPERVREMQEAEGMVEIKRLRIGRSDANIVGTGVLRPNAQGKLDGLVRVAIVGIERIVPLLGVDRLLGQALNQLAGSQGSSTQGLRALDRLAPGLGSIVREATNASLIENLKQLGEPVEIDQKPAISLPLRISDGAIYIGLLRLGELPPLF